MTVTEIVAVAVSVPFPPVTVKLVAEMVVDGVPERTPVLAFKLSPVGRVPPDIEYVGLVVKFVAV